jgi:hypothetical protein
MAVESYYAAQLDKTDKVLTLVIGYFPDPEKNKSRFIYRPYGKLDELLYDGFNLQHLAMVHYGHQKEWNDMMEHIFVRNLKRLSVNFPAKKHIIAVEEEEIIPAWRQRILTNE